MPIYSTGSFSGSTGDGTVGGLIDRIYRSWLAHPDDVPTRFRLSAGITDTDTSLTFDGTYLTVEEQELFAPGVMIELGSELMICGTVDEANNTVSGLIRGAHGTVPVDHDADELGAISPTWSRRAVFDAVADALMSLWPNLYRVATSDAMSISASGPTEVTADVVKPLWFWRRSSVDASDWRKVPVQFFDQFPGSSTGKAIAVSAEGTGYLVYRARFVRPTDESDDLQDDVGIDVEWERLVEVGAVAHLVAGRDVERLTLEHLSEQLENEGVQVGSASQVRNSLITYEQYLRDKAEATLRGRYPTPIERHGLVS